MSREPTPTPLHELLSRLEVAAKLPRGKPAQRIAVAKAMTYLRDNHQQVRLSIRGHLGIGACHEL